MKVVYFLLFLPFTTNPLFPLLLRLLPSPILRNHFRSLYSGREDRLSPCLDYGEGQRRLESTQSDKQTLEHIVQELGGDVDEARPHCVLSENVVPEVNRKVQRRFGVLHSSDDSD